MKKIIALLAILSVFLTEHSLQAQSLPVPEGRRLREIIADKYSDGNLLVGGTTGEWAFGTATGKIMDREFSYVTPENDFKQRPIHPDNSDTWNWDKPDRWIDHIAENGQVLRMHGPISPQCSDWARDDSRTAEELETNMRAFMQAICERYDGTPGFEYLDVVNEVVRSGEWHKNKPGTNWEVPWFIIGQDDDPNNTPLYIRYAFEIANEYAPNTKLIFNHHERTIIDASWDRIKETIAYLGNLGLRVDGIGWQAHLNVGWEKIAGQQQALAELIDWAHQNDLEFHITEMDVYLDGNTEQDYENQAATYKAMFDILVAKSKNGKVRWNMWHIDDGHGWKGDTYPSFFDAQYRAKPAYYAIQLALESRGDYTTPYQVTVLARHKGTEDVLENCTVTLKGRTRTTNELGEALFEEITAGRYVVEVRGEHLQTTVRKNVNVISDTSVTLFLDSTSYEVNYQVEDARTGRPIPSVSVTTAAGDGLTGLDGRVGFQMIAAVHEVFFFTPVTTSFRPVIRSVQIPH